MSHFTVTVRLTKERLGRHAGEIEAALEEMLAPFEESPKDGSPFLEFVDDEDGYREEYDSENDSWIDIGPALADEQPNTKTMRIHNGRRLVRSWDEMFRVPGEIGIGTHTHKVPDEYKEVEVPYKELHATLEAFVADYHGVEHRDSTHNRFGHYRNPNAKWDWWVVGGRWTGLYPLKPDARRVGRPGVFGTPAESDKGDAVRIADVDWDAVANKQREWFAEFKDEYRRFLKGEQFKPFEGPRSRMLEIGLLRVEHGPYTSPKTNELLLPWSAIKTLAADDGWTDVALDLPDAELERFACTFNPIKTFAALDDNGWHEPGKMGWFGCSSASAETYLPFAEAFVEKFIKPCGPDDLIVVVDCHI